MQNRKAFQILPAILSLLAGTTVPAAEADLAKALAAMNADSIRARIVTLSSDEFEGRAPATPGEDKTIAWLAAEFRKLGLKPGNPDGSWLQDVPMIGITSQIGLRFNAGATVLDPTPMTECVTHSHRVARRLEIKDSEVVFVGYGTVAPEYDWDDFKGVDVRGKTVVMLVGDPPVPDPHDPAKLDAAVFKGRAMTYYGRWTYKYDIASARGAAACLIVHETGPAGYPFAVLGGTAGREECDLRTRDGNAGRVAVEGWLTLDTSRKLFAAAGQDFAALKKSAVRRDFKPVALAATASFTVDNRIREVASHNVVARLDGADAQVRDEWVIFSAHWDHLGRDPRLPGDQIFNGALDNATGVAALLEIAQGFAAAPRAPRRSVLFIAFTAEEKGLLGSRYYAENPLYPLTKTLADINFDGFQTFGPARDLEVIGAGNSTLEDLAAAIAARTGRVLVPDTESEKGYFYRSDHFELAKQGVPGFYTQRGIDIAGRPAGYGKQRREEYIAADYHKPSDEIKPWWDLAGAVTDAQLMLELGWRVADGDAWPEWKPGSEFKARRDALLQAGKAP